MPAYYSLMDVFVHPSLRDGMPNAVLEAMACEKAVVATPIGGVVDVVEDGKNGIPAQDVAFRELIKSVTYWGNHRMIRMLKAYTTAFYDYKFLSN
jgi:glycosyltransferase involved in cell wall biosynthesis